MVSAYEPSDQMQMDWRHGAVVSKEQNYCMLALLVLGWVTIWYATNQPGQLSLEFLRGH